MTPINIDLTDLVSAFTLTDTEIQSIESAVIDQISTVYWEKWNTIVRNGLHGTRQEYVKSMFQQRTAPNEVVFGLEDNPLAMMVEDGASPFDMKVGFAKSSKVKQKIGGGWYMDIPFRHATSQAIADSGGFASVMPVSIYRRAKEANGIPLTKGQLGKYDQKGSRPAINTPGLNVPEYMHKAPIYQGIVRVRANSTPTEKRGMYMTFRRVSDTSDYASWFHSGMVARKFMEEAVDLTEIDKVTDQVLDIVLDEILNYK